MKIFAVVLLLLNVAYVGWMWFGVGNRTAGQVEINDSVPAEPAFVQAQERLMLVSERPAQLPAETAEVVAAEPDIAPPDTAESEEPAQSWCAIAGPFPDSETATSFQTDVNALGGITELQSEEFPISSTWWVHLPPFPTEDAAAVVLRDLQAKNIDSYYIRTGELAGAISLGVFSRSARAAIAQQELSAQGYSPSVREIVRSGTRFNVSLRLENQQIRQASEWSDLQADLQTAELQEIACK
jgi:hypothetical protein